MSDKRFSLDSNILVYAVDRDAGGRHRLACEIVERAARLHCSLAIQALAEFFWAATRKNLVPKRDAAAQVRNWLVLFPTIASDADALAVAAAWAERGRLAFWDALILATASRAGCVVLISEDMADGTSIGGTVVRNPFSGGQLTEKVCQLLAG